MRNNILLLMMLFILIVVGFIAPLFNNEFGTSHSVNDIEGLEQTFNDQSQEWGAVEFFQSLSTAFFWSFGLVPIWLDLIILLPLRIIFYVILYDKFRGVSS